MRVQCAAVALVGVTLMPVVGEASPITPESLPPGNTAAADSGYSPLLDASGDPILLLSSVNAFEPPGDHGKLRGRPEPGGIVFSPIGGPSSGGAWTGFGGGNPWGGGTPGGPSGTPEPGFFTLLSFSTENQGSGDHTPDPGADQGFPPSFFGFGSGPTFSFESCCEEDATAVPEPSALVLLGSGLALALKRAIARRSSAR